MCDLSQLSLHNPIAFLTAKKRELLQQKHYDKTVLHATAMLVGNEGNKEQSEGPDWS